MMTFSFVFTFTAAVGWKMPTHPDFLLDHLVLTVQAAGILQLNFVLGSDSSDTLGLWPMTYLVAPFAHVSKLVHVVPSSSQSVEHHPVSSFSIHGLIGFCIIIISCCEVIICCCENIIGCCWYSFLVHGFCCLPVFSGTSWQFLHMVLNQISDIVIKIIIL